MRKLTTSPDGISPFDKEGIAKLNLGEDATAGELKIEETRLVQEWEAQVYTKNRKEEYDLLNQFELISDDSINSTTTHKDAIVAIKTKWPKDNSGPV